MSYTIPENALTLVTLCDQQLYQPKGSHLRFRIQQLHIQNVQFSQSPEKLTFTTDVSTLAE